jgi:small nuclear ribonucleoprotein
MLPHHLLEKSVGSAVVVELAGDRRLEGTLAAFDEHLNLVLGQATEVAAGAGRPVGTVVVRGNHVVSIRLA